MSRRESAGLLLFRRSVAGAGGEATAPDRIEVLLGHPGGPYWAGRHEGAWSVPKGGVDRGETALEAAVREFREETGFESAAPYLTLGTVVQRSGKLVHVWAFEGDCDPAQSRSVMTTTEWPPRSGRRIQIPELDRVAFFSIDDARTVINVGQVAILDRLLDQVRGSAGP